MRRREFIAGLAGTVAWPVAARAQQSTMPMVRFLDTRSPDGMTDRLRAFRQGLKDIGFVEGENVTIEYRWAENLRSLVPGAARVAVLVNPVNVALAETATRDVEAAARAMALQIKIVNASTSDEIHAAFERLSRDPADALFVSSDPFFLIRRVQLATLAARLGLPTSFSTRDLVEAGGLMSYGTDINDAYRQTGVYTGRILLGAKPADLPVMQSTKFELVINLVTARMLGLSVPQSLLATADEVIE
jgi:putative ABC transport system substrate-binding protein